MTADPLARSRPAAPVRRPIAVLAMPPVLMAAALVAVAVLAIATQTINHDSAWYLEATARFLDGARLYDDIIEINPPLAFYLTVPPVWLAKTVGVSAIPVFFGYVFAVMGVSLFLVGRLVAAVPFARPSAKATVLWTVFGALVLGSWFQIGQREHFAIMLAMPYLILAGVRADGGQPSARLSVAAGLMAAAGFALKPYFLLVPIAVELALRLDRGAARRWFRPETVALGLALLAYAALVWSTTPLFLTRIVPWAMATYDALSVPLPQVLLRGELLLLLLAVAVHVRYGRRAPWSGMSTVVLSACAAFYAVYVMQQKGFGYHLFPARTLLIVAFVTALVSLLWRPTVAGSPPATRFAPSVIAGALLTFMTVWMIGTGGYSNAFLDRHLARVQAAAGGGPVHVLSTNVSWTYPLVNYARVESASRFPTLWLLPGVVQGLARPPAEAATAKAELRAIETYLIDAIIADFEAHRPTLVVVDIRKSKPYLAGMPLDYIEFLSRDPRFVRIWARYEMIGATGSAQLYRRR